MRSSQIGVVALLFFGIASCASAPSPTENGHALLNLVQAGDMLGVKAYLAKNETDYKDLELCKSGVSSVTGCEGTEDGVIVGNSFVPSSELSNLLLRNIGILHDKAKACADAAKSPARSPQRAACLKDAVILYCPGCDGNQSIDPGSQDACGKAWVPNSGCNELAVAYKLVEKQDEATAEIDAKQAQRQAEQDAHEHYEKATDSRCRFIYHLPKTHGSDDPSPLLRKAGVSIRDFYQQNDQAENWLRFIFNNSVFEMRHQATPRFLFGYLTPAVQRRTRASDGGISLDSVYSLVGPGGNLYVLFPGVKSVPCGWVMVYPLKWRVDAQDYLEILAARFVPSHPQQ